MLQDRGFVRKREAMTGRAGFSGIALKIEYDDSASSEGVPP
jgi:hypothetical protein